MFVLFLCSREDILLESWLLHMSTEVADELSLITLNWIRLCLSPVKDWNIPWDLHQTFEGPMRTIDNYSCELCSTEPISGWKVSLYWWTSKSFCDKPLLSKHILSVLRHFWKFNSLGDILIFAGSTKKGRTEMSHLVLFHRPECSFKTDKVGSVKSHLMKHHRNHAVYAHMYGLHLGYLITSNGMLLNLQRPDYSWKEHKMIKIIEGVGWGECHRLRSVALFHESY